MCGIVGIVDYSRNTTKNILKTMTDMLSHRGLDDSGYIFTENDKYQLGFAHRRLSIQDLSIYGHQPMRYEYLTIVYNGEVYNFKDIKLELEEFGYRFNSNSDTEVVLKAFHKWGVKSVDRFRGMFSFSIYNKQTKKIYLFRDIAGVKPLYYYHKDKIFLYASELKAFYKHPKFEKIIDKDALSLYLQFGYIQAPHTIFQNTYKLEPAHYLEYDLALKSFKIKSYWNIVDFYHEGKLNISYDEAKNDLEKIVTESFSLRMISDVSVGTFLSGGVDSSLVTAILQQHSDKPINTFTIGFDDEKYNEAHYAKKIANYLGTKHTEYYCSKQDTIDIITKLPEIYDEPFADSSAIPTTLVSRLAKEKVSVILSGDGGDELFNGYTSYGLFDKRYKVIQGIPLKKVLKTILDYIPDPIVKMQKYNEKYYLKYLKLKNALGYNSISNMFKVSNSVFTKYEVEKILFGTYFFQCDDHYNKLNNLEQMMISDFKAYLADDILVKVDRASMSISLESREPFLDHKIIEFVAKLPIDYKQDKKILKDILSEYIPRELFERKKRGFGIPINSWLRDDFRYLIDEYLNDQTIKDIGIFNVKYIQDLKSLFFQRKNNDMKIWTILMFQMWYKKNMKEVF